MSTLGVCPVGMCAAVTIAAGSEHDGAGFGQIGRGLLGSILPRVAPRGAGEGLTRVTPRPV